MITMKDVALEAGVSRPTVSLVLNGRSNKIRISDATKKRILLAAEKLGYRRNAIAQSMKTGKTNVIGIIGGLVGEYTLGIIQGVNTCVQNSGYLVKLISPQLNQSYKEMAHTCIEQRLSGVICNPANEKLLDVLYHELRPHGIPVVLVDNCFAHDWCPRVISDDKMGISLAVKHLVELGHTRIGHLSAIDGSSFVAIREDGFMASMLEYGFDISENNICRIENLLETTPKMHKAFDEFFQKFKPTAVVCASDPLAAKLLQWAYDRSIRIPEQLSVVGFANLNYTFSLSPALTTVEQPFAALGTRAAQKLIEMIEDKKEQCDEILPVKLIVRNSTAKPN